MEELKYPAWQKAYHEALLELDPQRLSERIHAAETLIASRLGELRIGPKNPEEQQALLDARSALLVIQRTELAGEKESSMQSRRVPMQDSYLMSWKEHYLHVLLESDAEKLTELVHATEQAIILRAQELLNSSDHHEERREMDVAKECLLAIKTHKLGWPSVPTAGS